MWKWILIIFDFIRSLLVKKVELVDQQDKDIKELEEQRQVIEGKVEEKYDHEEAAIPTGGDELVDYWSDRGVHSGPPNSTPTVRKGGTKAS